MHVPVSPKICYSIPRLAELTDRSARSWWRDVREGRIKTVRLGERVFVRHADLLVYLEAHSDSTGAPLREAPAHIRRRVEAARLAAGTAT